MGRILWHREGAAGAVSFRAAPKRSRGFGYAEPIGTHDHPPAQKMVPASFPGAHDFADHRRVDSRCPVGTASAKTHTGRGRDRYSEAPRPATVIAFAPAG